MKKKTSIDDDPLQAYSRLIVTCSTFALYSGSFTKSANQALAAIEAGELGDQAMHKRWEFLKKFESNFNHWWVSSKFVSCVSSDSTIDPQV